MGAFEPYDQELKDLDKEIRHYAAICGVDPNNRHELDAVFHDHQATGSRETLRALLILRVKVETDMLQDDITPPKTDIPVTGEN